MPQFDIEEFLKKSESVEEQVRLISEARKKVKALVAEKKENGTWETQDEFPDIEAEYVILTDLVKENIDNLKEIHSFLTENSKKFIEKLNETNEFNIEEILSKDMSELSDEEREFVEEYNKAGDIEANFERIFSDERATKLFFDKIYPQTLNEMFGLSREEYDKIFAEIETEIDKEEILEEFIKRIALKEPEQDDKSLISFGNRSVTEQLEMSGYGQNMK